MRFSKGVPFGRFAKLHNPEMFQKYETVIVFTVEEMNRRYNSIMAEIEFINKINLHLDKNEEWKLIGYWPKIMRSVHNIDLNMDMIFKKEPLQSYLDVYLYKNIHTPQNVAVSPSKAIATIKDSINLL
ncbi:MAG: hypothetical protein QME14_04495 [Methanobacteriaceae archaeon]|nr:hypothetical protein [Methanobacteriaceae archaeon]